MAKEKETGNVAEGPDTGPVQELPAGADKAEKPLPAEAMETTEAEAQPAEKAAEPEKPMPKSQENTEQEPAGKTGQKKSRQSPKAFLEKNLVPITAIICVAIAIIAMGTFFGPEEGKVDDFWNDDVPDPVDTGQLRMIIVSSDKCPGCHIGSSLRVLFEANDVNYAIIEYEEKTVDGAGLIQALGIEKLPAFIIEEDSLTNSMLVETKERGKQPIKDVLNSYVAKGKGSLGEGIFVFPEMFLDDLQHSNILLGDACGNEENLMIHLFLDPYDPHTIKRSKDIETAMEFLTAEPDLNVSFRYSYLPTYSTGLAQAYLNAFGGNPATVKDNIEGAARYLVCANDNGVENFVDMQRAIYSTYCEIEWETIQGSDVTSLWECGDSNHFGFFLDADELIEATERAGVENDIDFGLCLYTVENRFVAMKELADGIGIDRTPTALINCQYEVPITNMLAALCLVDEKYGFCKQY